MERDFSNLFGAVMAAFGGTAVYDPDGNAQEFDCVFEITQEEDFNNNVIVEVATIEFKASDLSPSQIDHNTVFAKGGNRYQALYPPSVDEAGWAVVRARKTL